MKKFLFILTATLALGCAEASAQSWLDALKGAATSAIDKATGGKLTEKAIIGTWKYSQPAVKLTSSTNALSDVAGSAASSTLQSKIKPYYEKVGIKPGACTFVFNSDGTFSSTIGQRTSTGTYTFDGKNNQIALKYDSGILNTKAITAYAYLNGTNLQLAFAMDKLITVLTTLGSNIESLSTMTALLKQYDGIKIGFEFSK
ncbi:MAG: DUF4923 family protein [Alistipes sp.]|nr:DUF4923 family protein [Alistipes sp.]